MNDDVKVGSEWFAYGSTARVRVLRVLGPLVLYRRLDGKRWWFGVTTRAELLKRYYS
jgi:hypothetical protein